MQPVDIGLAILLLHAALSALDALVNRSWMEQHGVHAVRELKLRAWRSWIYLLVLGGLAWFEWHGGFAVVLTLLVVGEFALRLAEAAAVERARQPTPLELAGHIALGISTGVWAGFVLNTAWSQWLAASTRLEPMAYGMVSWWLTIAGVGAGVMALHAARLAACAEREARYLPPSTRPREDRHPFPG